MDGFRHQVVGSQFRQLLAHQMGVVLIGVDVYVLARNDAGKAVVGLLKLRATRAEKVDELLRVFLTAARPQATALAAGQYHAKIFTSCCHVYS